MNYETITTLLYTSAAVVQNLGLIGGDCWKIRTGEDRPGPGQGVAKRYLLFSSLCVQTDVTFKLSGKTNLVFPLK